MMKYSVLMSLYIKENPEYLCIAIDSMINQTVKPDEIVIVKDGPLTDELERVLDKYVEKYSGLFCIVKSNINLGLGEALNLGLRYCKNELIARMDTDDISKPERCEKQLYIFENNPKLDILGTFVDEFYNSPNVIVSTRRVPISHNEIYDYAKRRSAFNHPTVMFKKSKILKQGGYCNLKRNQDLELFGRLLYLGCISSNINESLLYYRANDKLAKRRKSWENTKSYVQIIRKFWKMGYSELGDYIIIIIVQTFIFIIPVKLQRLVYKIFLRR